jgi:hypothetical protein
MPADFGIRALVAKKSRKREKLSAPTTDYAGPDRSVLTLRGSLTPATRREYAELMSGGLRAAATQEDLWHRGVEFLFERLAVSWTVAGVETTRQKELLARFRVSTRAERDWIRGVLREHIAEWFPEVEAP